jgi:hypothetical protein
MSVLVVTHTSGVEVMARSTRARYLNRNGCPVMKGWTGSAMTPPPSASSTSNWSITICS